MGSTLISHKNAYKNKTKLIVKFPERPLRASVDRVKFSTFKGSLLLLYNFLLNHC